MGFLGIVDFVRHESDLAGIMINLLDNVVLNEGRVVVTNLSDHPKTALSVDFIIDSSEGHETLRV